MSSPYIQVEIFQLTFLRFIERLLPKSDFALKGGCNLRFFFKSIRCSEDIDLDIWTTPPERLQDRVNRVLGSKEFINALLVKGLRIQNVRAHKQSETTQRWKMAVLAPGAALELPTKIEFSRRTAKDEKRTLLELIDPELTGIRQVPPVLTPHYSAGAAFEQKVQALLNRKETQARDVFDLHLLHRRPEVSELYRTRKDEFRPALCTERILAIDFATFNSQVVAFLEADYQDFYRSPKQWETIQLELIDWLERAA